VRNSTLSIASHRQWVHVWVMENERNALEVAEKSWDRSLVAAERYMVMDWTVFLLV